jgi:hypothetical protein
MFFKLTKLLLFLKYSTSGLGYFSLKLFSSKFLNLFFMLFSLAKLFYLIIQLIFRSFQSTLLVSK